MQSHDLSADPAVANPNPSDRSTMAEEVSTPIHGEGSSPPEQQLQNNHTKENNHNHERNNENNSGIKNENNSGIKNENNSGTKNENNNGNTTNTTVSSRRERPSRACTARSAAANRLYASAAAQVIERKPRPPKKEKCDEPQEPPQTQCSKIVTPLVSSPPLSQLPRWNLRSMWELASILNFLNVFRPLLNISIEFSAEEFETALLMPNSTLDDIHIPLLKAIPPVTRMALGRATWVTVLCRKLRDWWHWVAEGDIPIIASHGAEVELYKALDPAVRVVILKALCDIRVEQEDIRNYIESSIKHGVQLSAFRKERIGGDSCGISYWYEDDPIIGHRLYRDTRKVDVKKVKGKNVPPILGSSYQWETVATNLDEFQDVSEKLFSSKNRTEASLGKKLKNDMLPEIEKVHKRKERLLKKQHRQALLLDNFINIDGLAPGRSLRDRKPVTYTFDDYDRSINEAIKITKKQQSPEPTVRREVLAKTEASTNGRWSGTPQIGQNDSFDALSPKSPDFDEVDEDPKPEQFDRSNRRRQRPQRYSERDFVEAVSDNDADFYSDEDIVGEAVYDEEYLKKRKQTRKPSSSSEAEGDDEYKWDEEKTEDDEEEEEEEEDDDDDESLSMSDNSDEPRRRFKKLKPGRTRRETKLRSVVEIQSGLRRSKRATRNRIDYRQYEISDSENETVKPEKSIEDSSRGSRDLEGNDDDNEIKSEQIPMEEDFTEKPVESEEKEPCEKSNSPSQDEIEGVRKRRFLDLNELAPGSMKDEDTDDF